MYAPPALTFATFARASGNVAAVEAALLVADDRPEAPALLVLHGPSGAGKTHLLCAIGDRRRASGGESGAAVEYVTLRDLVERVGGAATRPRGGAHAHRYAAADLLLVDDAQSAVGDAEAQGELARLLAQGKAGRCVVLAVDGPPAVVAAADPALARLIAAATVCEIGPVDGALRRRATPADVARYVPAPEATPAPAFAPPRPAPDAPHSSEPPSALPADYASFLSDVVAAVAQHVEPWKQQLAEASARWGALGYAVNVLDRALARPKAPNVDGLLATYAAAVEHLRRLEAQAAAIDPALVDAAAFRDPERVADAEAALARLLPGAPDARLTRAAFDVGASNAGAASAADLAAAAPAAAHNPLYVHGPSGSGRTHLACAVANALRGWRGGRVGYVTAAHFADELSTAMRANTVERWRARYLVLDVLVIDDVQHAASNARAEQEIALLCATLRDRGRQVVLAGASDPGAADAFGDTLRAQVQRGAAAPLGAPDRELCARLLERYFAGARCDVGPDVVAYLAARVEPSAHEVPPLADRLIAAADRAGGPLTLPVARAELGRTPASTPLSAVPPAGERVDAFFLDAEKVVWDWPDAPGRVIEEVR